MSDTLRLHTLLVISRQKDAFQDNEGELEIDLVKISQSVWMFCHLIKEERLWVFYAKK